MIIRQISEQYLSLTIQNKNQNVLRKGGDPETKV